MSLFAIGDLHLSLSSDKPMDVFGEKWKNHTEKLRNGMAELQPDDVCVICGDLSWGMSFKECCEDFHFIDSLPGKKIILKGNHDYWWSTASKARSFFAQEGITSLEILNNNCLFYDDIALCGTRGWFFEEETGKEHDRKIMLREVGRLKTSLEAAGSAEKIVFLHYPPIYSGYKCEEIMDLLEQYHVKLCCYGHLHGKSCGGACTGWYGSTEYRLVSADYVDFHPVRLI